MIRLFAITVAASLAWIAGAVEPRPGVDAGVVVEETRGTSAVLRREARAEVAALRARGVAAEMRVARSPSEALAAASTLATRGAGRLVLFRPDPVAVLGPLRAERPALRLEVRR